MVAKPALAVKLNILLQTEPFKPLVAHSSDPGFTAAIFSFTKDSHNHR